jgi:hypothetical protein
VFRYDPIQQMPSRPARLSIEAQFLFCQWLHGFAPALRPGVGRNSRRLRTTAGNAESKQEGSYGGAGFQKQPGQTIETAVTREALSNVFSWL